MTTTNVRITFGETEFTGTLSENATARDLAAQLPLTLAFRDHNHVEKTAPLPRELSLEGAPAGHDPVAGDIGYWAPAGNLVFYYDSDAPYWERDRAHRRVPRRPGRARAPERRLQRHDRARGLTMARVFITGSADGLGRAAAETLLGDGHDVVVHARSADRLAAVRDSSIAARQPSPGTWPTWSRRAVAARSTPRPDGRGDPQRRRDDAGRNPGRSTSWRHTCSPR